MEALAHGAEHFTKACGLRARDAQRPGHLLLIEVQHLADGGGGAEHAGGAGDVPADVIMGGIDGVADAAFHFHADDEGVQQLGAAQGLIFRHGKNRRGDGAGGMDDGLQMGVVEVEHVARDAVEQGGVHHVEMLAAAQDRGLSGACEGGQRRDGAVQRLVTRATDGAAHPVQEGGHAGLADIGGDIREARAHDPAGEHAGDFLRHGGSFELCSKWFGVRGRAQARPLQPSPGA